jgi:cytochrome c biogenesis protein
VKTDSDSIATSLWRFFSSLKLTIFLLIGLASVSIIGTVIPQGTPPPAEYIASISQAKFRLYQGLGFFDMYHSWWFILLLYLLTLNLVACSLRRLPRDWKMIATPAAVLDETLEKSLPFSRAWKTSGNAGEIRRRIEAVLRKEFAEPLVTKVNDEYHLFAEKGRYSRLGVYLLHASIVVVFIGTIIGSLFGYKAFVSIPEGESVSTAVIAKRNFYQNLLELLGRNSGTSEVGVGMGESMGGVSVDLGFSVRCDSFTVTYYDTGAPKEYKSILSVTDNGRTVIDRRPVIVNRPLTYRGITFYQSSFSPAGPPTFYFTARDRKKGGAVKITARQEEKVRLPNGDALQPLDYIADIKSHVPNVSGPAVKVALYPKNGEPQFILLLQRYPSFDEQRGGELVLTYDGVKESWRTGLQVAKDPGVWIVWIGCFGLVGGLLTAFFLSHRRVWVRVAGGRVAMAGSASKNQAVFRRKFEEMADEMKQT